MCRTVATYTDTHIARYVKITGCTWMEADKVMEMAVTRYIEPDDILSIALMGYNNENIESMMHEQDGAVLIQLILKFRIFPRK